jgi:peptidoglycan/xylan/chitin deacetylase (PgdA/CDA1 family)
VSTVTGVGDKPVVHICFHGIGTPGPDADSGEADYFVSEELFLAVLDEIADRTDVRLSFDDGNASDFEIALPAMLGRGLAATFFPLAGLLGQPGYLSAGQVGELAQAGMSIGSHGMMHRSWRGMSQEATREELVAARDVLAAAAGAPVDTAACPFGAYDRGVLKSLREHRYRRVFTSDRRRATPGAWLQARYSVHRGDTPDSVRTGILAGPRPAERARGVVAARLKAWR